MIIEIVIFIFTTVIAYCVYSHKKIHYELDKKGVRYVPGWPLFGNTFRSMFLLCHAIDDLDAVYRAFPDEKYVGFIEGPSKAILVRDPDIIKDIMAKHFDRFVNRKQLIPVENYPLFGGSLFLMQGDKWRDMRTTLSPAFTGSKMRHMMPFMVEISNNLVKYLESKDFYDKLGVKILFSEEVLGFFRDIITNSIEYRTKNNIRRADIIQLLIDTSKGTIQHEDNTADDNVGFATTQEMLKPRENATKWSLHDLTSQVFLFFGAGYETVSSTLFLCVHELALNPDPQETLYQEIRRFKETRGELTYDNIVELKYLDCVLNETMRKYSVAIVLDRVCLKEFELPPPREGAEPYLLKPGDSVYAPVNSLHRDPRYFERAAAFVPERFADENKHNIRPFTFMPFGAGPRNCIGSRFALLELKVMMYNLILHYRVLKCDKTLDPIVLKPADFNLHVLGGSFVVFEKRS